MTSFPNQQQKYNGRINIQDNKHLPFDVVQENKDISFLPFKKQAVSHIISSTTLTNYYFSDENQKIIQNELRRRVWEMSGRKYIIDEQSPTELQIIMRSIYLQYSKNNETNIKEQISELNEHVLDYSTQRVYTNLIQYIGYKKDVSNLPTPLEHSMQVGMKGSRSLFMPNFF